MTPDPAATAAAWTADQTSQLLTTVSNLQQQNSVILTIAVFGLGILAAYCLLSMITRGIKGE